MSVQTMSDEELRQARGQHVSEITDLNQRIATAKLSPHKKERHQLELKRNFEYQALQNIDAELEQRGLDPENTFGSG